MSTKAAFLIFLIFWLKLEFCESVSTKDFVQKNSDNKSAGTQEMFLQNNEITAAGFSSLTTTLNNNLLQDLNFNFTVPTDNVTASIAETGLELERGTIVANGSITVVKEITTWDRIWVYLKHIIWIPVVVVLVSCSCIYIYTKHWIEKRDSRASVFRGDRSREVSVHVIE